MSSVIKLACDPKVVRIAVGNILATRVTTPVTRQCRKYQSIVASIKELGLIEPLVVYRELQPNGQYLLLDGHLRLDILKSMNETEVPCLLSHDDEAYTYNHKVNRLSAIQEHFMILRAIENGVPEKRIATSLNVDIECIRRKADLLDGICPEVAVLLKDKKTTAGAFREIKRVKPMRQIEISELMVSSHNYSVDYAKCLIAATPPDQLIDADRPKDANGLTADEMARMEREMETLGREFRLIEETHGQNTLNLVVAVAYLKKLLDNARVVRHLSQNYPELLTEFQKLVETKSLKEP
jgi:hypothetical protein